MRELTEDYAAGVATASMGIGIGAAPGVMRTAFHVASPLHSR
jgi:hypothetical protein